MGGKRKRRVESATANVQRSKLEEDVLRRQIASRVSNAYWTALGASRAKDLLQRALENFERVVEYNRSRVKEGAAPEVDLLRTEVERDRLTSSVKIAQQDADRATIVLFREMGKTEFPSVELVDSLDEVHPVPILPLTQVLDQRPVMQVAREAVELARANLRLQKANAKPDPDVEVGYKRNLGGRVAANPVVPVNTLYGSIQIPLPIRNRNQGQIEAAVAEIKAADAPRHRQ